MEYREEMKEIVSKGKSRSQGGSSQTGMASGAGEGGTVTWPEDDMSRDPFSTSISDSHFQSTSESESESWSESESESTSYVPTLVPVLGKELSHVQFRSLEEQLFRSMAVLFDQEQRQGVARLVGMNAPVSIRTPDVHKPPALPERTKRYLATCYEKLPFALPATKAHQQISDRAKTFAQELFQQASGEPTTAKRRIK